MKYLLSQLIKKKSMVRLQPLTVLALPALYTRIYRSIICPEPLNWRCSGVTTGLNYTSPRSDPLVTD